MKVYRFLKDYETFKSGDTAEIDAATADVLLKAGMVEVVDEAAEKAAKDQLKSIETMVAGVVEKALAALPKGEMGPNVNLKLEVTKNEGDEGFESLGEQLEAVMKAAEPGAVIDKRLLAVKAISGMNETVGSEGGFLVQSQFSNNLIKNAFGESVFAPDASSITIGANANSLHWNEREDYNQSDGNRQLSVHWTQEGGSTTKSEGKFNKQSLGLEKMTGLYYATEESLQDAQSLEQLMDEWFQEEYSIKIDEAILNGDGVAKPLGFNNTNAAVTQAKVTSQTATTFNVTNAAEMYTRQSALEGAKWYMNITLMPQLVNMTVGDQPVYTPPNEGIKGAPGGYLLGKPIIWTDRCETLGTAGDVWLANLGHYRMISKGGLSKQSSIHVRFLYGEETFRTVLRINGQPMNSKVITRNNSPTASPFVKLATRA